MNNYKILIDSHFKTLASILEKDKLNQYAIMFLDKHNKMVNLFTTELDAESDDENIKYFMDKHLEIMKDLLFGCYFDDDAEINNSSSGETEEIIVSNNESLRFGEQSSPNTKNASVSISAAESKRIYRNKLKEQLGEENYRKIESLKRKERRKRSAEHRSPTKSQQTLQQPAQQTVQSMLGTVGNYPQPASPRSETFEGKYYGQLSNKNLLR